MWGQGAGVNPASLWPSPVHGWREIQFPSCPADTFPRKVRSKWRHSSHGMLLHRVSRGGWNTNQTTRCPVSRSTPGRRRGSFLQGTSPVACACQTIGKFLKVSAPVSVSGTWRGYVSVIPSSAMRITWTESGPWILGNCQKCRTSGLGNASLHFNKIYRGFKCVLSQNALIWNIYNYNRKAVTSVKHLQAQFLFWKQYRRFQPKTLPLPGETSVFSWGHWENWPPFQMLFEY